MGQQTGGKRKKGGIFSFFGELSKIVFGMMDQDDAQYYNEKIKLFEKNSKDMNTLIKQQLYVVKSSLGAVNNPLADVEYNGSILKEGMNRVARYMNTFKSETSEKMNLFSANIEIEGHILRVNNLMNTLQHNLDLLIESVIKLGVLQPQVIPHLSWWMC